MNKNVVQDLLKQVSRSFYLSLRLLPGPMREPAGLAYLLARASDTIADSAQAARALRLESLHLFAQQIAGTATHTSWPEHLVMAVEDAHERDLLTKTHRLLDWLQESPDEQLTLIRQVLSTIIDGQIFDLEWFGGAKTGSPVSMPDASMLDCYTYQVAGCVGEFWTRLGFLTLGAEFSNEPLSLLCDRAVNYGKGLQMVNILRDLPRDLDTGRCYLPVRYSQSRKALLIEHQIQLERAGSLIRQGFEYASKLSSRRLRTASVLPAILAEETLELMRHADWPQLNAGIKVPRRRVYVSLLEAILH